MNVCSVFIVVAKIHAAKEECKYFCVITIKNELNLFEFYFGRRVGLLNENNKQAEESILM